jgi:kinesin family protein 6/9
MMRVTNEPVVNVQYDPLVSDSIGMINHKFFNHQMLVKKYEQEIKDLKAELAMHDALANRGRVNYEAYTDEQKYELQQQIRKFLAGDIDDIEVLSERKIAHFATGRKSQTSEGDFSSIQDYC